MFALRFNKVKSFFENKTSKLIGRTCRSATKALDELKSRVAVRFFVKKSKRFGLPSCQGIQEMREDAKVNVKIEASTECLRYLGLAPKGEKLRSREKVKKVEKPLDDFLFTKPRVFECEHCPKIFFHKLLYRRHMIRHWTKIHWCLRCNRAFTTKIAKKRHQLVCRR